MSTGPLHGERAQVLDALRGFAIFGILIANIQFFSGAVMVEEARGRGPLFAGANGAVEFLIAWFVDGKFYSLFSLLFGIGFAVLLTRAERDGRDFRTFYRRRLWVLLGIGLIHAYLLWFGDILTLYALLGFALLSFRTRSDAALVRWIVVLFALPVVQYAVMFAISAAAAPAAASAAEPAGGEDMMAFVTRTLASGTWLEITRLNIGGVFMARYPDLLFTGRPFKVLATFLIGLWIGRHGIWAAPHEHLPLLRRVAVLGLGIGLPLNLALALLMKTDAFYALRPLGLLQSVVYGIGVPALALGYAAGFTLLYQRAAGRRVLDLLAPAGRMALTNYIGHSVICMAIFYGWGFGLFGSIGLATTTLMALGICAAQVAAAAVWLRFFRFGPLEWVWRSLTYGRRQPMRRAAAPAGVDTPVRVPVT